MHWGKLCTELCVLGKTAQKNSYIEGNVYENEYAFVGRTKGRLVV